MKLDNKVAIITGGAGGIGQGIVRRFLAEGAKVVVVDLNQAQGDELVANLADLGEVHFIAKDISLAESATEIVAETVARFGKLDVLVNNAHASRQAPILETTPDMWDLSMGTGLMATFNLMRAAHPELVKTTGSIVNFASGAGIKGLPTPTARMRTRTRSIPSSDPVCRSNTCMASGTDESRLPALAIPVSQTWWLHDLQVLTRTTHSVICLVPLSAVISRNGVSACKS